MSHWDRLEKFYVRAGEIAIGSCTSTECKTRYMTCSVGCDHCLGTDQHDLYYCSRCLAAKEAPAQLHHYVGLYSTLERRVKGIAALVKT